MAVTGNGIAKMLDILVSKLDMIEHTPDMPWLQYGATMPICFTSGMPLEGGSAVLADISMSLKNQRIPVFASFIALKNRGLILKPNQHGIPIPYTKVTIVHKDTGVKILPVEYNKLPLTEKDNYCFYSKSDYLTVFNIEQTKAEITHPELWHELQERYAGAPPSFQSVNREFSEIDVLVESMRPNYIDYFPDKNVNGSLRDYYSKCAQVLAYIAYKSLPRQNSDILAKEPKFALLASEIAGVFICSNYGIHAIPNPNFLSNITGIRQLISSQPELLPDILLRSNRMGAVLNKELHRCEGEACKQKAMNHISMYLEKASEINRKVIGKDEQLGISIKGLLQKGKAENGKSVESGISRSR